MDLTGYGYKRPAQEQRIAPSPTRPVPQRSAELSAEAVRLLDGLSRKCQLRELPARFPRVLNRIATVWNRPAAVERCFEELLLDTRGKRAGFPLEVLSELLALRSCSASRMQKKFDPWQEMHLR